MSVEVNTYSGSDTGAPMVTRLLRRVIVAGRPALDWPAFLLIVLLALMPALTLRTTEWVSLGNFQTAVDLAGPLGVCCVWLLAGWRGGRKTVAARHRARTRRSRWAGALLVAAYFAIGYLVILQLVAGWLPGPMVVWTMLMEGNWIGPINHVVTEWSRVGSRLGLWRQGILAGGAAQDNLVVALLIASGFWLIAGFAAMLARKTGKGLIIALPLLWIVLIQLAYSGEGRGIFVNALLVAIALHLVLDQEQLKARWAQLNLDYNPGIGVERLMIGLVVVAIIMGAAAIFPNVYITPVAQAYYDYMAPLNEQIEGSVERIVPEARGISRMRRGGMAGGLPNDFLLQGGPDLRQIEVLRYRTNEPWFTDFPFEDMGPPGYYMRGGTYVHYNGRGWGNPGGLDRVPIEAEERRAVELEYGRKELVQSVMLAGSTQILFAAPEILEASVDFRLESRAEHDVVAAWSRERSYTVVSATPAMSEAELRALPALDSARLAGEDLAPHLALPDSITERTHQLAFELTGGQETAYDQAAAIEAYLRTFEYDLSVTTPPGNVADIADYFLFELQRGYCDYYATAFVVLARIAGLPARFATGFSTGYWDPMDTSHVVTEADAHSWPEVYFPEVGWIPFEPTAAQPLISRIGQTTFTPIEGSGATVAPVTSSGQETGEADGSWQVWLWLIPLALVGWLGFRLARTSRQRSADPWGEMLAWGRRLGRPIDTHETPLEYGRNLGRYVLERVRSNQDTGRLVAREMQGLGADVSDWRYGPEGNKTDAGARAKTRWSRLRGYRRSIRV